MKTLQSALCILLLLVASSAAAQTCPPFPERGAQIIDALVPQYPGGRPGGTDDERRLLTRAVIEQLAFEFPQDGWMWKSADPGRPPSKDAIARQFGGRLCVWDWQNGGTRARAVQPGQIGEDITGQTPIPVSPVNHLAAVPTAPGGLPSAPGVPVDLSGVLRRLDRLVEDAGVPAGDSLHAQMERIYADLVARLEEQKQLVEQHDKKPGSNAMSSTLGNRYVQIFGAAAGAFIAAWQAR